MQRGDGEYEAEIRTTTHGVVHVRAGSWGDLGFGQGWACARDHLPTIADQVVKVRSERARFHGEGPRGHHVATDLGYLALGLRDRAPALRDAQPDHIQELVRGYTAGCNAWLDETRASGALPPWCADADWLRPFDDLDLWTYLGDVALMASGRNLVGLVGRAEAPGPDGPVPPSPVEGLGPAGASNGWAFGRDVTASGGGLVLANPHFPWYGEARFWECHLTLPGELDVYGVSLLGAPGVQMGFNEHVAWAHTFSCGHRFTVARLDLVPGEPTTYRWGDEHRTMEPTTYAVEVRDPGGGLRTVERTLWRTHHGPMLNLPLLGWGTEVGFAYRDANLDNTGVIELFLRMDRATGLDELERAFADTKGMPWVNTLAADRTGRVLYTDASATPNLGPGAERRFVDRLASDPLAALLHANRIALLDGSDPDDDWVEEDGARSPGLVPHDRLPRLARTDWVANANDSHWLTNPAEPLEGYSALHGLERTARSLRTRQNIRTVERLCRQPGGVTVEAAVAAVLGNESLSAEFVLDEVIARCRMAGTVVVEGHRADLAAVADVLEAWDRRCELGSVGAALWREAMASLPDTAFVGAGPLFSVPFDPADPVATPAGPPPPADRAGAGDPIAEAVGHAVRALAAAGVPLDAPLGQVQWAARGERRVAVHGGGEREGVTNVLAPLGALAPASLEPLPPPLELIPGRSERTGLGIGGYQVAYGTSFLMAVELTADGPRGVGLLAYGQSGDPASPHHADGTEAYAAKALRPLRFRDADIEADPRLDRRVVRGSRA